MASIKIQELIDEHKESMPDDLYLKLCNLNMQANATETGFYEVTYVKPDFYYDDFGCINATVVMQTIILKLNEEEYKHIIENGRQENGVLFYTGRVVEKIKLSIYECKFQTSCDDEECGVTCIDRSCAIISIKQV